MAKNARTQLIYIWIGEREDEQCHMYVRINMMNSLDKRP